MIDPITFEVVRNGLIGVANEMAVTIVRTAHSQVLRDSLDFSTAVCDRSGRVVAQGLGMALHLGAIPDAMEALLDKHEVRPGDVFVNNDPLQGGMHLPDIFMFKPVFDDGGLVGFAVCVAHYPDIGGRTPGGNAVDSTEIYQEGLQIPLLRLDDTLREVLAKNVRLPAAVMGDLNAQIGSCRIGEARMLALVERHGADGLQALMDEILDYTERRAREGIRGLRDGSYSFVDHIDDDGMGSGRSRSPSASRSPATSWRRTSPAPPARCARRSTPRRRGPSPPCTPRSSACSTSRSTRTTASTGPCAW